MMRFQKFKTIMSAAILGAIFFPLLALAADKKAPKNAADINGKIISYEEFSHQLDMFKQQVLRGQPGQLPEALKKKLEDQVLEKMIADELLFQHATKKGIKLKGETIDAEINKIKGRFKDEMQYREKLKGVGLTEEKLRGQIRQQATISELIQKEIVPKVEVNDQDAKKYYDANTDKFRQPESVRARHILMKVEKGDSEEKKTEARKKLQAIKKRILAGEDFSALAKEASQGPTNVKGGDLGYFTKGKMAKEFEEVAFKLEPNETSNIVETQFGYHLIKVIDHKAAIEPPYEEIKPKIISLLKNEQVQKKMEPYVVALREKAKVKVYIK